MDIARFTIELEKKKRFQFQFLNSFSVWERLLIIQSKRESYKTMKLPFFFFKKRLRKYSSRVVAGYKAALSPCYRKGRYKKDEGRGRSRDARYSGSGSIVKEEKERRGRERVVIQDLFSQTVTAGPVLLARFKGYRIPHRFCQHLPLICRGNGKPIATTLLHHRTSKKNIFLQQ